MTDPAPQGGPNVGDTMPCEWFINDPDDDGNFPPCPELSRFIIERADYDPSYVPAESCEDHLGATIANLLEGTDIRAIVSVRWDAPAAVAGRDAAGGGR